MSAKSRIFRAISRAVRKSRRYVPVPSRRILGIACTGHGASICYFDRDGNLRASVLDRWAGVKHCMMFSAAEVEDLRHPNSDVDREIHRIFVEAFGRFPAVRVFEEAFSPWMEWLLEDLAVRPADIDLVVTSDGHFATGWTRLGPELNRWFPNAVIHRHIEHHEIHQSQAFWQSGFEQAAVLTLDTCGEGLDRLNDRKLAGTICFMNRRGKRRVLREFLYPDCSAGAIYNSVSAHIGFHQGEEGKTMGLAAYGTPDLYDRLKGRLQLNPDGGFSFLSEEELVQALNDHVARRTPGDELLAGHKDVAYAGQAIIESIVVHSWKAALRLTRQQNLAYAGGVALNSVANGIALRQVRPKGLYIATNPGDTGHALGCALFGAYELSGWPPPKEELPEYLGRPFGALEIQVAARSWSGPLRETSRSEEIAAHCIANGYIVARFAGSAEYGPRALGNRSILCDPRPPDMKDFLNARVKHREPFRPFAPAVLAEHAGDWFEMEESSPFMLLVAKVRQEKAGLIPAVVHVDATGRLQTVGERDNPGFRRLIEAFHKRTGIPLVLNTSFNVAGKPIVETPIDAVRCFERTEIDVLALDRFLLSKKPLRNYLQPRGSVQPVDAEA